MMLWASQTPTNAVVGLALLLSGSLGMVPAEAQDTLVVTDGPACADCTIEFVREASIGGDDDSFGHVKDDAHRTAFLSNGEFWVASSQVGGHLLRYAPDGTLLQEYDYRGDGPGEFLAPMGLVAKGDSLVVLGGTRILVYDAEGEPARFERLYLQPFSISPMGDSTLLVQGITPDPSGPGAKPETPSGVAEQIVRIGLDDMDRTGFPAPFDGLTSKERRRTEVAASRDGGFWTIPENRYQFRKWDSSGALISVLVRESDWFEPWRYEDWDTPRDDGVPTRITYINEDTEGLLWTVTFVQDEDFVPFPARRDGLYHKDHPQLDAMVEVLDPDRGVVLARRRFPGTTSRFLSGGRIAFYEATSNFAQVIHFGRFELRGR